MKAKEISVARVIRMAMLGSFLLVAGMIGFASKAHAQDAGDIFVQVVTTVVGNVVANVTVAGMDGVSCGATAGINAKFRGGNGGYNQYQRAADYNSCIAQVNAQRQQAYYQQQAMEQYARAMAMQNAPRVQTNATSTQCYMQNGRQVCVQENFQQTQYGRPNWVR